MSVRFVWLGAALATVLVMILLAGATATSAQAIGPTSPLLAAVHPGVISTKTVRVGSDPNVELYDPTNHEMYVANYGGSNVTAVNSTTYAVKSIAVGSGPLILTYSASSKDVYVLDFELKVIKVISSANKVIHNITLPGDAFTQIYDPANGDVLVEVSTTTGAEISDVNHATYALKNVALPALGIFLAYDNASSSVVVPCTDLNELVAISSTDVATTIKLTTGLSPAWMTYNPDDKDLYVSDLGETSHGVTKTGNISVLSSINKIIGTVKVGEFPFFSSYDPANHDIYTVNVGVKTNGTYPASTISVIGPSAPFTVVKTITVGKGAGVATYDPKNREMYISAPASNKTYAINSTTNAIAATITTTQYATASLYDSALGDMIAVGFTTFVDTTSTAKTVVTVIPSSNTGTSTLTLGTGAAGGVGYDPTDSGLWITNEGAKSVSVIL